MHNHNFECPRCGGRNTQTYEAAYLQNTRYGSYTYNALAQRVAPPDPKSTVFTPVVLSSISAYLAIFLVPVALHYFQIPTGELNISPREPLTWKAGLACGALLGYLRRAVAKRYNATTLEEQFKVWERKMICRRCSHAFALPTEEASQ